MLHLREGVAGDPEERQEQSANAEAACLHKCNWHPAPARRSTYRSAHSVECEMSNLNVRALAHDRPF